MFSIMQIVAQTHGEDSSRYQFNLFDDDATMNLLRSEAWLKEQKALFDRKNAYWSPIILDVEENE